MDSKIFSIIPSLYNPHFSCLKCKKNTVFFLAVGIVEIEKPYCSKINFKNCQKNLSPRQIPGKFYARTGSVRLAKFPVKASGFDPARFFNSRMIAAIVKV